jgi:hypothetical protein
MNAARLSAGLSSATPGDNSRGLEVSALTARGRDAIAGAAGDLAAGASTMGAGAGGGAVTVLAVAFPNDATGLPEAPEFSTGCEGFFMDRMARRIWYRKPMNDGREEEWQISLFQNARKV